MSNAVQNVSATSAPETYQSLALPHLGRRLVEWVTGSERRDALEIIAGAKIDDWGCVAEPVREVLIQQGQRHIRFRFAAPGELAVVSVAGAHGSLALEGKCELAQYLAKVAVAQLSFLQNQVAHEVEQRLKLENPFLGCPVQYEHRNTHNVTGPGGFNSSWSSRGVVEMPCGRVELESGGDEWRLPIGEYSKRSEERQRDFVDRQMAKQSILSSGFPGSSGYGSFASSETAERALRELSIPRVPPAEGGKSYAGAKLVHPMLTTAYVSFTGRGLESALALKEDTIRSLMNLVRLRHEEASRQNSIS